MQELSGRDAVVGYSVGLISELETDVDEATVSIPEESDISNEEKESCSSGSLGELFWDCELKKGSEMRMVIDVDDTAELVGDESRTAPQPDTGVYPDIPSLIVTPRHP